MPSPSDAPALDLEVLKGYVGDDPAHIREFLLKFRHSAAEGAHELAAAIIAPEMADASARIARVAHTLKSTARAAGATHLGDLLAELEKAATRQDIGAMRQDYEAYAREYPRVQRRLQELLPT